MANNIGTAIRDEFYKFLGPIAGVRISGVGASSLISLIGHPHSLGVDPQLKAEFARIAGFVDAIADIGDEELNSWEGIIHVLSLTDNIIEAIDSLDSTIITLPDNAKDLGKELIEKLFTIYLRSHHPNLFHIASFLTIITPAELGRFVPMEVENGEIKRLSRSNDIIHFEKISDIFSNLANVLREAYLPNNMEDGENAHQAANLLFYHLRKIARHWNLHWEEDIERVAPEIPQTDVTDTDNLDEDYDDYDDYRDIDGEPDELSNIEPPDLTEYYRNYSPRFKLFSPAGTGANGSQSTIGLAINASSGAHEYLKGKKGFILKLNGERSWSSKVNGWDLSLLVTGAFPALLIGSDGMGSTAGGNSRATFTAKSPDYKSGQIFHLGASSGTRIEIPGFQFTTDLAVNNDHELIIEAVSKDSTLVVQPTDGFLSAILPENGLRTTFDFGFGWSSKYGFFFSGSAGLIATLPVNLSLGPLSVHTISIRLNTNKDGLKKEITTSVETKIGPIQASIEGVGLLAGLDFKKEIDGNFGPLDIGFELKPPSGIALTIDTGVVTGGGYLRLDPDTGEYSGALQLKFAKICLNAIGILNTKMPDGSKGYSLLLIISAEFTPAIQLGFGFNLSKVGGLFGAHRNVVVEVMRDGLRSNSLGNILFPQDPVNNAPAIISNLRTIFPVQQDRYVFGPMASITWGTPKILTIELGLLLEMPAPLRIIVLGRIRMALPTEEAALVKINLDMLGVIDFGKQTIAIDATLFDSRFTAYTLSGDMAMRMDYGNKPMFALSIGGMHPAFNKPPAFPALDRVAVSLSAGNNPRMRLEAYLALTSNTAQLGARLDLYAAAGNWNVSGTLGFDALFQFSPFYFIVDIYGSVALKRKSKHIMALGVAFSLSGPNPWRAKGKATIKILLFKGSISFNMTVGQKKAEALPTADIWPLLKSALESDDNWSAQLPREGQAFVVFKEESAEKVHPLGTIEFRQQIVPFNLAIQKFGNAQPSGANHFKIEGIQIGSSSSTISETKEHFAPAQFLDLSEKEKLSRPSFEHFTAGARVQSAKADCSEGILKALEYNQIIVDNQHDLPMATLKLNPKLQSIINRNKAALRTHIQKTGFERYKSPPIGISMKAKAYTVTDKKTMTPVAFKGSSYAETAQYMSGMKVRQNYQVVELNERSHE